jgi:hypothetical protein
VGQNAKTGKPSGKQSGDAVGEKYVEPRHPAFAEAQQQDSRGGDGKDDEKAQAEIVPRI